MLLFGLVLGGLLIALGLLTSWLAPRLGPNPIFGFRIGYAYASRETWDRTNRLGGLLIALAGAVTLAAALAQSLLNPPQETGPGLVTTIMFVALAVAVVSATLYARRLALGTPLARTLHPVQFRWRYVAPVLLSFAILLAVAAVAYPQLPAARMASHFNFAEQADGFMPRDTFMLTYLGLALFLVAIDLAAVAISTREPVIAIGRWGGWRLEPERGLVLTGIVLGLTLLLLTVVLLNVVAYNTRGALLFPFSLVLALIIPFILIVVALFFLFAQREP